MTNGRRGPLAPFGAAHWFGDELLFIIPPVPHYALNSYKGTRIILLVGLLFDFYSYHLVVAKLFSYSWTMGAFMCKLVHYLQSVSAVCSVLTLTAMSLERYYAIVHPMRAKYICTISQARRIIAAIWVASFLLAVPMIFVQVQVSVGVRVKAFWCVPDDSQPLLWRSHELYMLLLILVVPTAVMGLAYSAICWEVWRVVQRRYHMTSGRPLADGQLERLSSRGPGRGRTQEARRPPEEDNSTVKQVIKMLVAVVVLFVVCWAPLLVLNVLRAYGVVPSHSPGVSKHTATAFHLMAYFNSCINPLVYGFMSRNFRDSFQKALCRCWGRRRRGLASRHPSLSQTRTTSVRRLRPVTLPGEAKRRPSLRGWCLKLEAACWCLRGAKPPPPPPAPPAAGPAIALALLPPLPPTPPPPQLPPTFESPPAY